VPYSVSAVDDITDPLELEYSHAPGSTFSLGVTPVTVSARDEGGNTGTCSFQVTVQDTVAPTLNCPRSIFFQATGSGPVEVPYPDVQAVDAVSPVTVEFEPPAGTLFAVGESTSVLATARDSSGNERTCRFNVTVELPSDDEDGESGCACGASASGASWWGALLLLLALTRLRHTAARRSA
jgi:MYXO-CTERM domain-containing protein